MEVQNLFSRDLRTLIMKKPQTLFAFPQFETSSGPNQNMAAYVRFNRARVHHSKLVWEDARGTIVVDFNRRGRVVGVELVEFNK